MPDWLRPVYLLLSLTSLSNACQIYFENGTIVSMDLSPFDERVGTLGGDVVEMFCRSTSGITLSGSIPTDLSNLSNMRRWTIEEANYEGGFPVIVGLEGLEYFASDLSFVEEVPTTFNVSFPFIKTLVLNGGHNLQGTIPMDSFTKLRHIEDLEVKLNRRVKGTLPESWDTPNLVQLDLRDSEITGTIGQLRGLDSLYTINLDRCSLEGTLPQVWTLSSLRFLSVQNNVLTGTIPDTFIGLSLGSLSVEGNRFVGTMPPGVANWTTPKSGLGIGCKGTGCTSCSFGYVPGFNCTRTGICGTGTFLEDYQCKPVRCAVENASCEEGTCFGETGNGECTECDDTHFGALCEKQVVCLDFTVGTCERGSCSGKNGTGECTSCVAGRRGDACEDTECYFGQGVCDQGDECDIKGVCQRCFPGYAGPTCEIQVECGEAGLCLNGTCSDVLGDGLCTACQPGAFGPTCVDQVACDAQRGICNQGSCSGVLGSGMCDACTPEGFGPTCEGVVSCRNGTCLEGSCFSLDGDGHCTVCDVGFEGADCDTPSTSDGGTNQGTVIQAVSVGLCVAILVALVEAASWRKVQQQNNEVEVADIGSRKSTIADPITDLESSNPMTSAKHEKGETGQVEQQDQKVTDADVESPNPSSSSTEQEKGEAAE